MLRHRHRAQTAQLTLPVSGVAVAVLATLLVGAPAAHAAPTPDNQVAGCGDSVENWTGQTLTGFQYHDNDMERDVIPSVSTFTFPAKKFIANWNMFWRDPIGNRGTANTDEYRLTGPSTIEFSSDLGTGKGDMWQFRLTAVECNPAGKVVAATANTYFPPFHYPFKTPVTHYGTAAGYPLRLGA
jgi:hypothetical protein